MHFILSILLSFIGLSVRFTFAAGCDSQILLPPPGGPFEVGLGIMELVDYSRTQPFAPSVQPRKLMVSLFYPVNSARGTTPANYMPPETALLEDEELSGFGLSTPNGTLEKLALQLAGKNSRVYPRHGGPAFPAVLFSPAQGTTRLFYSAIAQTISSSGYVVVTIDAPYDVDIVEYPDGSLALANTTVANKATPSTIDLAVDVRAQDASFVLDQLTNKTVIANLIPGSTKGLNVSKVAMFGHSLGGAAAATAMLNDTRIAGGLAMDGALWGPVVQKGLDRPFMFMARAGHLRNNNSIAADPYNTWFDIWPNLRTFRLDLVLANSLHYTFSDFPVVLQTLDIVPNNATAQALQVTDLDGRRALKIVTTYVTAFLDFVLHGKNSALLKGPVPEFPEITFDR
jgi:pimeloyl-ACP methyl ester carboxylesterase